MKDFEFPPTTPLMFNAEKMKDFEDRLWTVSTYTENGIHYWKIQPVATDGWIYALRGPIFGDRENEVYYLGTLVTL